MDIAKIKVNGAKAITVFTRTITKGMVGAQVQVEYNDPVWDGLRKQIVFQAGETTLNADGNMVPPELLRRSGDVLWVGVYGCNEDGSVQVPTIWTNLGTVQPGADPQGDASAKPTLPVFARLEQQMEILSQKVDGLDIPEVDGTLSIGGAAADAKVVGDRLTALEDGNFATEERVGEIVTEALAQHPSGGYIGTYALTLRADAWKEATEPVAGYNFVCDVEVEGVKGNHVPVGATDAAYSDIADKAGVRNACETYDGYIRFLAKRKPEGDIAVAVTLFGPGVGVEGSNGNYILPVATATTLGGIKLGVGMSVEEDGTVNITGASVADETIATADDASEMLDEIFADTEGE